MPTSIRAMLDGEEPDVQKPPAPTGPPGIGAHLVVVLACSLVLAVFWGTLALLVYLALR